MADGGVGEAAVAEGAKSAGEAAAATTAADTAGTVAATTAGTAAAADTIGTAAATSTAAGATAAGTSAATAGAAGATAAGTTTGLTIGQQLAISAGSSLASGAIQKMMTPTLSGAPQPASVLDMPSADGDAVAAAKKKSIIEQMASRGRASTILTDNSDKLGG